MGGCSIAVSARIATARSRSAICMVRLAVPRACNPWWPAASSRAAFGEGVFTHVEKERSAGSLALRVQRRTSRFGLGSVIDFPASYTPSSPSRLRSSDCANQTLWGTVPALPTDDREPAAETDVKDGIEAGGRREGANALILPELTVRLIEGRLVGGRPSCIQARRRVAGGARHRPAAGCSHPGDPRDRSALRTPQRRLGFSHSFSFFLVVIEPIGHV
jgi:hypothetical protein